MSQSNQPTYMKMSDQSDSLQSGSSSAQSGGESFKMASPGRTVDLAAAYRSGRMSVSSARGLSIGSGRGGSLSMMRRAA